jgi:ABC-type polar amino acid transport system ATPase subunit
VSDEPKTAFEIAMEKLRSRDEEQGKAPPKKLTEAQKDRIAEMRNFYGSKLAEREILYQDELKKAGMDPEKRDEVEEAYQEDRKRLAQERDEKITKIKG